MATVAVAVVANPSNPKNNPTVSKKCEAHLAAAEGVSAARY